MNAPLPAGVAFADAPALDYEPTPDFLRMPPGMNFGRVSGVAFNSRGHLFVFHRGPGPLAEFDADGVFVRAWGDGLFQRPHGLRIDHEDNIWVTDGGDGIAVKFNPQGRIVMVLGVQGRTGDWHPHGHLRLLQEPNEVVVAPNGDLFIPQGHGKADSCIQKFDRNGNFIKAWGRTGSGPGEFDVPHSIVIDKAGLLHVADRSNGRIQVFDAEGTFIREHATPGTPCGLCLDAGGHLWLAHGHEGRLVKLDLTGNVLGAAGGQGKGRGQFGEAHYIAMGPRGDIFIADPLNWRVERFARRTG